PPTSLVTLPACLAVVLPSFIHRNVKTPNITFLISVFSSPYSSSNIPLQNSSNHGTSARTWSLRIYRDRKLYIRRTSLPAAFSVQHHGFNFRGIFLALTCFRSDRADPLVSHQIEFVPQNALVILIIVSFL
ncbi:hypothetical protein SERLA73DRAFT_184035, partial [Serpula lacrymans var. lacrymans S7.3]